MALPRRDVRLKLDDDVHRDLVACCDVDGVEMAAYIERLVIEDTKRRLAEAVSLVQRTGRCGTSGNERERRA